MTMRFVAILALALGLMVVSGVTSDASAKYARGEDTFVIPTALAKVANGTAPVVEANDQAAPEKWSARQVAEKVASDDIVWFVAEEIKYINRGKVVDDEGKMVKVNTYETDTPVYIPGMELRVPVYVSKHVPCGDIRNWHVAVLKGSKYGVSPRLLLGIRNAENPFHEGIGYGVVAYRGTNLWVQAEQSCICIRKIIGDHALNPEGHFVRLRKGYVQHESESWDKTVPYIYRISLYRPS